MPQLDIPDLPEEIHEALRLRAQRTGRSLEQQAIADLRRMPELKVRQRRMEIIERLRWSLEEGPGRPPLTPPEALVRQDRDGRKA